MKTPLVLAAAALAVVAVGCGSSGSDSAAPPASMPTSTAMAAAPAMAKASVVDVKNFDFAPATLMVKRGTKVTWKNADAANHTVTFGGAGAPPSVDNLAQGASASRTFTKAGTYRYACTFHPNMKAAVVVTQ